MVSKDEVTGLSILVDKKHLTAADTDPKGPKLTSPTAGRTIRHYAQGSPVQFMSASSSRARSVVARIKQSLAPTRAMEPPSGSL